MIHTHQEGEADAKRRAIEEVEAEKEALVQAKRRADTLAISKEAEAMKAKMQAAQAQVQYHRFPAFVQPAQGRSTHNGIEQYEYRYICMYRYI